MTDEAEAALRSFCGQLRRLLRETGGLTVAKLAADPAIPRSRAQIYAVLNGEIRKPPSWDFVRPYVEACVAYAREHGNAMSLPTDTRRWRSDLNALEDLFDGAAGATTVLLATESLPADVTSFVGRQAEIDAVQLSAVPPNAPAVFLIHGMAGVGKSAIAVHVAHRLRERYPHGRLFVNLGGNRPDRPPLTAAEALAILLGAVGVPATVMPADVDDRSAAWRHRVHDKRLVLVLDDAADAEQVRPLLPGTAGSLVLITSRNRMPALVNARPLAVEPLSEQEAYDLFVAIAGRRFERDAEVIRAVVARCGHLPLAVSLVAGNLRAHPAWSAERLLAELDGSGVGELAAALHVSYHALDPPLQETYRRLSVHPGNDIDSWAVAALLGAAPELASARLESLYRYHFLDEASQDRFRLHDLIREDATRRGEDDSAGERTAAERRLLQFYVATARTAGSFFATRPGRESTADQPGPVVGTAEAAASWLNADIANITACVARWWEAHPREVAVLSDAVHPFLRQAGPWDTALQIHETALGAARRLGDRPIVARALLHYGGTCTLMDRYADAVAALRESAGLAAADDDPLLYADALAYLGMALRFNGDFTAAAEVLADAVERFAANDDATGEASATVSLAVAARLSGDYQGAHDIIVRAVEAAQRSTHLPTRAIALSELGVTQYLLGQYAAAAGSLTSALELARHLENRLGEATALNYLGPAQYLGGNYPAAIDSLTQALELFRQLGERLGSADALSQLGVAYCLAGEYATAAERHRQSIAEFHALGNALGEAVARNELGSDLRGLGRVADAHAEISAAIPVLRGLKYKPGLEEALNNLGRTELALGRPAEGLACHEEALTLADDTRVPLERARAHEGLGRCRAAGPTGDLPAARADLSTALAMYRALRSPLADALVADFPTLTSGDT